MLKVDLEQTQRMVEREEGLSLAHKFNCSFYETSAAHRCHSLPYQHNWPLLFRRHVDDVFHTLVREIRKRDEEGEFKENETSRWKKVWNNIFKTIKRGRRKVWESTFLLFSRFSHLQRSKFCIFQVSEDYSDFLPRSFTKPGVKDYIFEFCCCYQNNETFWASKTWRLLWSSTSLSNIFLTYFSFQNCFVGVCHSFKHAMIHSRVNFSFKGASETNIALFTRCDKYHWYH